MQAPGSRARPAPYNTHHTRAASPRRCQRDIPDARTKPNGFFFTFYSFPFQIEGFQGRAVSVSLHVPVWLPRWHIPSKRNVNERVLTPSVAELSQP